MAAYAGTTRQQVRHALRQAAKRKNYTPEVKAAQKRAGYAPRGTSGRSYNRAVWPGEGKPSHWSDVRGWVRDKAALLGGAFTGGKR